ncbi:putative Outer membrane lipoprotein Slp [Nitrospira sp. KM1]|uniref:Slp family lipoprotein n=1 Tax=Nitrospira sp. KM1 TaxID=1936990 RepID=UPI0013A79DD1|nr:Slp family lipoprotein [Nitrospira sp. KM1]BCA55767.1 putative Outer membrane lipoprotein Slp [Nitrospira sp. KM1]
MRIHLRAYGYAALFLALLAGCASSQESDDSVPVNRVTFAQVKGSPDSYRGQEVQLGGEVLSAKRLREGTRIEILQLPLDRSGAPGSDLTQSQGRFVALHKEFLDPATIPHGTRVTVTGDVTGSVTLPLDETEYTYPTVDARKLQVWNVSEQSYPRSRPYPYSYYGPGPYWGPYWSPYWRPWPYW